MFLSNLGPLSPLEALLSFLSFCCFTSSVLATCQGSQPGIVRISNGTLHGVVDNNNGVERFLGIPYAQPPVGGLRLRQAVPLNASFGVLKAQEFGAACLPNPGGSEDCLALNIWRPLNTTANSSLPVFVWFYGGGLTRGSTSDPLLEGTNMVRLSSQINKPIILVSVNYRLGPLGFLNGKQMQELGLLNLGMKDQRLALQWVQENIGAFGGDKKKVTIGGQSAGAVSSYSHMMAYGGRDDGLFRAAVLQSGGAFPLTSASSPAFQATFDQLVNNTVCASTRDATAVEQLDCIRQLPIDEFLATVGRSTGQSIDDFSPTSLRFALPAGKFVKVPVLVGANTDEGTLSAPKNINTTQQLFGPLADGYFRPQRLPNATVARLLELYPTDPRLGCPYNTGNVKFTPGQLDKMACSIFGDLVQIAPARMIASTLAAQGVNVYLYRFNHLAHNSSHVASGIGTGAELSFVFSNGVANHPWDQALASEVTAAWVSFVHDLDPNWGDGSALPHWSTYDADSMSNSMVLDGYGSYVEKDTYRQAAMQYIIDDVLPDGAM